MGWASGTEIFDDICEAIFKECTTMNKINRIRLIAEIFDTLTSHDWDTVNDSAYIEHPEVIKAIKLIDPSWFEEEVY